MRKKNIGNGYIFNKLSDIVGINSDILKDIFKVYEGIIKEEISKGNTTVKILGLGNLSLKKSKPRPYSDVHTKTVKMSKGKVKYSFTTSAKIIKELN